MDIVRRDVDIDRWRMVRDKVLVYGRRKVGKSFFIKNFTEWDNYFYVKRDGGIIDVVNMREVSRDLVKEVLLRERDRVHVIDEFHRLGGEFLDFLHAYSDSLGRVRLITSTLWLSRKILSEESPILGIFQEFKLGLIDERDIIRYTFENFGELDIINAAVYLREPWIIPMYNMEMDVVENISRILTEEKNTIERLIGEVFREEERELRRTYFAILSVVGSGKWKSSEISTELYSKRIIPKDDPSIIQSYLKTLINIGILKRIYVLNKKYNLITHSSPILDLYFYLDRHYGFSELDIPLKEVRKVVNERMPIHVEDFFRELFSKIFGLKAGKIIERDHEIDIVLYSFKRMKYIGEVKWRRKISEREIHRLNDIFSRYDYEKFLITPYSKTVEGKISRDVEIYDIGRLRELVRK